MAADMGLLPEQPAENGLVGHVYACTVVATDCFDWYYVGLR